MVPDGDGGVGACGSKCRVSGEWVRVSEGVRVKLEDEIAVG